MRHSDGLRAALAGAAVQNQDPDFENTVLLLHGDGTNGAQNNTFIDGSTNNFTITRNGNATQGTFSPFGDRWSNFNPDSAGGLGVASNAALNMGTGDFTVEAWVNTSKLPTTNQFITTPGGFQSIFGTGPNQSQTGTQLYIGVTNIKFDISNDFSGPIDVAHNMVAGQWYHVAITRSGNTFRAFINGILLQTGTSSASWTDGFNYGILRAEPIGGFDGAWWYGYVSNFRLIKGTAVYTSAFTPPTGPLTAIANTSLLTCQSNRFVDNSTNNFTITRNGDVRVEKFNPFGRSAPYSSSTDGGSGYFDGNGDYLSSPDSSALDLSGSTSWCIELWAYWNNLSGEQNLLEKFTGPTGPGWTLYKFAPSLGTIEIYGSTGSFNSGVTPIAGQWYHIVVCRDNASSRTSFFINGSRTATTTSFSIGSNASTSFLVGVRNGGTTFFNGYLSNPRVVKGSSVYDPSLTSITIPTAPLTAIANTSLLLNFANAGVIDNTGLNVLETVGNAQIDTGIKKFGTGSLEFDGSGDYLIVPANPSNRLSTAGNFTIELWAYFNSVAADQRLIAWDDNSTNFVVAFYTNTSGNLAYYISSTGTSWNIAQQVQIGNISTSTWYHIALVRNGSVFTPYLNGIAGTTTTSSATLTLSTLPFCVGAVGNGNSPFNGYIDDLRITNGIARYTANFTPPTAPFPDF